MFKKKDRREQQNKTDTFQSEMNVLRNHYRCCYHLRPAALERALWITDCSPCREGTVVDQTSNLWFHGQRPQPLSYLATGHSSRAAGQMIKHKRKAE